MSSTWDTAKDILRSVAPAIGTALGGPFGGMAAKAVTGLLLGDETDDQQIAAEAIRAATPDQLIALKKVDADFTAQMRALDIDLERIAAGDRDSARRRQVDTRDRMPGVIAAVALVGFFGILATVIFVTLPYTAESPLNIMLGVLGTLLAQIANYYFGSSAGSAARAATIDKLVGAPTKGRP